jgi:hypothetical protein
MAGNTPIAKNGDPALRKALYIPAIVAWKHNPLIHVFCERLNGKNGKAIVCAAMRKLIHLAFGVLKSGKAFDPTLLVNEGLTLVWQDGTSWLSLPSHIPLLWLFQRILLYALKQPVRQVRRRMLLHQFD